MLCSFCHHEFDDSLTECPYCHRIVEKEAKSLTVEERESFEGATIEVDGTVHGGTDTGSGGARTGEYQEDFDGGPSERADGRESDMHSSRFHSFHVGGFLFWAILAVVAVLVIFLVLPAFFLFALVAAAVFILYQFLSGFGI